MPFILGDNKRVKSSLHSWLTWRAAELPVDSHVLGYHLAPLGGSVLFLFSTVNLVVMILRTMAVIAGIQWSIHLVFLARSKEDREAGIVDIPLLTLNLPWFLKSCLKHPIEFHSHHKQVHCLTYPLLKQDVGKLIELFLELIHTCGLL